MYLTMKQQVRLCREDYENLRLLSHHAKNLYNEALYAIRQRFFETGKYLNYYAVYDRLKTSSENYRLLNSNMAQQILKESDGAFRSFFGLLKLKKAGLYEDEVHIPRYLDKEGYFTLVIGFVRLSGNKFIVPYSNRFRKDHRKIEITVPPQIAASRVKEIRIVPKADGRFFEVQYTYEAEDCINKEELELSKALSIDLGIDNLCTYVTSEGSSFLIDGRYLKSVNQWYNKNNARLQSIKDRQGIEGTTNQQARLQRKRHDRMNDYISKTAKYIVSYCVAEHIGTVVLGYNDGFQKAPNMGKVNNQTFVNIPFGMLKSKLTYLCAMHGIVLIIQEESYTSKASFFDGDEIPVYDPKAPKEYTFSGKRTKRGMYVTASGKKINADVNGALNILKKSNAVDLTALSGRGEVDTTVRVRLS